MANNNMELTRWGDGKVRLVYWEYFHGEDTVFVLDDGQAFRESYDDNMNPVREAVDLVQALEEFMQELEKFYKSEAETLDRSLGGGKSSGVLESTCRGDG